MESSRYQLSGVAVTALIVGSLSSLLTLSLVMTNSRVRSFVGLPTENGTTTHQEKIVLEESSAVIETVKKVSPSVVSITTTRNIRNFFGNVVEQKGGGTGFIITSDGMIVTNAHVVSDNRASYTVVTADGKDFEAKILAVDPIFDLAVVKIETSGLPVVELGNSDDLAIGQWVVAIGNALAEFQNTVTVGVVSAKDRQLGTGAERLEGLIQTDAAINPGNSGGPLVNLRGQVVGITTAKVSDGENLSFAIPINIAKSAIDSVKKSGNILRPRLGIRYVPITKKVARINELPVEQGALIAGGENGEPGVLANGPADKAGLKEGDIITKLNEEEITERRSLARLLQQYQVGDEVRLTYLRDKQEATVTVKLEKFE